LFVRKLALEDFRNYERAVLELDPGLNLLIGRNAQGKTNLLEGIYLLSGLGSPRSPDSALIREGGDRALVHGSVVRGSRTLEIDMELRSGRAPRVLVNKTAVPGTRELSEITTCVFFGPDELSLIKGSPEGRRRFLDDVIVKLRPARFGIRREWDRVLKQRNALLRSWPRSGDPRSAVETLEVWDEAFARAGAALAAARLEALGALLPFCRKRYEAVAGGGRIEVGYVSSWLSETLVLESLDGAEIDDGALQDALAGRLRELRSREIERGQSLSGPQRDDLAVRLASPGETLRDARSFGSQGEQRTGALALKLAEFDLLSDALDETPILLLDDVFSELDPARRASLSDAVRDMGQAILTSAEPGAAGSATANTVYEVVSGEVRRRD
jgi:DNA replication and repair protein RecF